MSLLFAIQSSGPLTKPFFKYQGATSFLHCHETELIKNDSNNNPQLRCEVQVSYLYCGICTYQVKPDLKITYRLQGIVEMS